jgi:hypothetical protein
MVILNILEYRAFSEQKYLEKSKHSTTMINVSVEN